MWRVRVFCPQTGFWHAAVHHARPTQGRLFIPFTMVQTFVEYNSVIPPQRVVIVRRRPIAGPDPVTWAKWEAFVAVLPAPSNPAFRLSSLFHFRLLQPFGG